MHRLRTLASHVAVVRNATASLDTSTSVRGGHTAASAAPGRAGRLQGKGAIVTGGGTGIGKGVALALAGEGCDVIVTGRRPEPLSGTVSDSAPLAGKVLAYPCDIADRDQSKLLEFALEQFNGSLDILVNNAGINIPQRSLSDITIDDWHKVVDVNLNGTFHLIHAILPQMRKQQDGLIINVTSIAGKRTISPLAGSSYCASKFAMNSLGEAINMEEHENGIRCTNICPGEVVSEILDKRPNPPSQAQRERMLMPEDIGAAAVMVACLPPRAHVTEIIMTGKSTIAEAI